MSTALAAQNIALMTEIAQSLTDEEWNSFVAAERARRATGAPLEISARVRFVATTKPRKIALATGRVVARKFTNGQWKYTVKMDHPSGLGQTFIRVDRNSIEVQSESDMIVYPAAR